MNFQNEDYQDLYKKSQSTETNSKTGGYVNISFIPKVENHRGRFR
jgi:hypothetical protein